MTSGEEQRALIHLAELLKRDLSKVDRKTIIEGIREVELLEDTQALLAWSGRLIAALHRDGASWSEVVKLTGLPQTTAYRRAQPYL